MLDTIFYQRKLLQKFFLVILAVCFISLSAFANNNSHKLKPVQVNARPVSLAKYSGRWYELASFPAFFQRNCICTQANYFATKKANVLGVLNKCIKAKRGGSLSSATGKAFVVKNSGNRKLKVQFFWPFKGDYWILYVSPGYRYAVVGNPKRNYLWLLSRTPKVSKKTYNRLVAIAARQNFDVAKLNRTPQVCGVL